MRKENVSWCIYIETVTVSITAECESERGVGPIACHAIHALPEGMNSLGMHLCMQRRRSGGVRLMVIHDSDCAVCKYVMCCLARPWIQSVAVYHIWVSVYMEGWIMSVTPSNCFLLAHALSCCNSVRHAMPHASCLLQLMCKLLLIYITQTFIRSFLGWLVHIHNICTYHALGCMIKQSPAY